MAIANLNFVFELDFFSLFWSHSIIENAIYFTCFDSPEERMIPLSSFIQVHSSIPFYPQTGYDSILLSPLAYTYPKHVRHYKKIANFHREART